MTAPVGCLGAAPVRAETLKPSFSETFDFYLWIQKFFENKSDAKIIQQNGTSFVSHPNFGVALDNLASIGCWFSYNNTCVSGIKTLIYCAVAPAPPSTSILYEVGTPCSQNSHCTKPGVNKCDTSLKLCYA